MLDTAVLGTVLHQSAFVIIIIISTVVVPALRNNRLTYNRCDRFDVSTTSVLYLPLKIHLSFKAIQKASLYVFRGS